MASHPLTDPNWAAETTDTVVRIVDNVRSKTTKPIIQTARGLVFGLLAAFLGLFAFFIFMIGLLRGAQALLELGVDHDQAVYLSYFIVGGIFCLIGLLLFRKRKQENAASV